ncbi:MAG: hypothetical protein CVV61_04465 [Tenericutes bacterium HGW-Tenericutes-6]|nr:MAG: hypothetical protein CVV61_04465 [Tenericutes bacterium HGW-Tenericutes-6]
MIQGLPKDIYEYIKNKACHKVTLGMSTASVFLCDDIVLKMDQTSYEISHEIDVLRKLEPLEITPRLIDFIEEKSMIYAIIQKLEGEDLSQSTHLKDPIRLIDLLIEGLHILWSIPTSNLDINYTLDDKLKEAEKRINEGLVDHNDFDESIIKNRFSSAHEILQHLKTHQPIIKDLVLSHGDYCLPNICATHKKVTGFIDLGRVGLDSKHQDIALCARSILYNLEDDIYQKMFYEKLNIPIDFDLIDYYLLLDELF